MLQLSIEEFRQKHQYNIATPIMQQYLDVKFAHQDCIIMFRLGDFYELFYDDAITISKLLALTLTKRSNKEQSVAMCGIPHHAAETYLPKIIDEGYKIAICEQQESPEEAKKRAGSKAVINRCVVRIITPGTIFEENLLNASNPNYLMSIVVNNQLAALAWLDVGTLEFSVMQLDLSLLSSELSRINPREIVVSQDLSSQVMQLIAPLRRKLAFQAESYFAEQKCIRSIISYYQIQSVASLGQLTSLQLRAIGAVLQYVEITQKSTLPKLTFPKIVDVQKLMIIDAATRKGLELVLSAAGKIKGSLFDSINRTMTKSGARALYKMIASPITDLEEINLRHNLVDLFKEHFTMTTSVTALLKKTDDLERILSRISMARANANDLLSIKNSMTICMQIKQLLINQFGFILPASLEVLAQHFKPQDQLLDEIDQAIQMDENNRACQICSIKSTYHGRIAELKNLLQNSQVLIESLRNKYGAASGIATLKITHNNILGFFIEVSAKQAASMDGAIFIHRQTTLGNARFTTKELQELEVQIVTAKSSLKNLEQEIVKTLCQKVLQEMAMLSQMAASLALLDVICCFASIAKEHNYTRPEMTQSGEFIIKAGRHIVVENSLQLKGEKFTANDCDLSDGQIWLLTGPNMAGKSTFLRQNALIAILAQSGCFVPADFAKLGIIDKIFSRIGASDDLASGQSTFMVEMVETANILAQASDKSLIILDEIGRGTSTYDGVSIAWSCLEYIASHIKAKTLFATHYHELAQLETQLPNVKNYHSVTQESAGKLLFARKIVPGAADKSYGINVAAIAGLPLAVIMRAKVLLKELEKTATNNSSLSLATQEVALPASQSSSDLLQSYLPIDVDQLTPRQALEHLYHLKTLTKN